MPGSAYRFLYFFLFIAAALFIPAASGIPAVPENPGYEDYTGTTTGQQLYIYADSDDWPEANNFELRVEDYRVGSYVDHLASGGNVCEIYYRAEDRYSRSTIDLSGLYSGVDELDTDGVTLRSYSPGTVVRQNQQTFRHGGGFEFEEQDHRSADEGLVGDATSDYNAYGLFNAISDDRHKDGTGLSGEYISDPADRSLRVSYGSSGRNELYGDLLCINPREKEVVDRAQWHLCSGHISYTREAQDGTEWECLETGEWVRADEFEFEGLGSPHRGGMNQAPENTLQAFENTRLIGLQSAEFDVRVTGDGEFIVHHDSNAERRTHSQDPHLPSIYPVGLLNAGDLVGLQARAEYAEGYDGGYCEGDPCMSDWDGWDYTVGQEESVSGGGHAVDAHHRYAYIPSLAETLDYFEEHNMVPRIELKGQAREHPATAREVYRMVEERGMVDSSIFFQLPSDCSSDWFGLGSWGCEWKGLEAIEEASNGEAVTAASYRGDIDRVWDALDEAEEADVDIIDTSLDFPGWCEASTFAEEAHDRGMGFAGIRSPEDTSQQKRMEIVLNGVYTSANTPEWLKDRIEEVNERDSRELEIPECLPPREPDISGQIASDLKEAAGEFEPATEDDRLTYLTGKVSYNINDRTWGPNPSVIKKVEDINE